MRERADVLGQREELHQVLHDGGRHRGQHAQGLLLPTHLDALGTMLVDGLSNSGQVTAVSPRFILSVI